MNDDEWEAPPRHRMSVAQLRALLAELCDDDVLVPNRVRNLAIVRDDADYGYVDFLEGYPSVEIYANSST